MKGLEAKIAFRSFRSIKETSFISFTAWITLLGIAVGVMSLVVVMSVMNGFEEELQRNIIDTESHILLYRKRKGIDNWQKIKKDIKKVHPSIQGVLPITYNEVLFIHKGKVQGGILEGVDAKSSHVLAPLADKQVQGSECFIGEELALRLNLKKGDTVRVMLPSPDVQRTPKLIELRVAGVFESGLYEYSSRYVYADLSYVQKHLGWKDRVSAFKVRISEPEKAIEIARKIRSDIEFPFFVRTWIHMNQNLFMAIKMEKVIMAIILAAIVGVALFNVVSSLIMIVIQKKKEISILKALGMTNGRIQKIFLFQGLFMGIIGTAIGLISAFVICAILSHFKFIHLSPDIYYLSYLPVKVRPIEVMVICVVMMIVSFFAAFLPARRAARLFPTEGIRYE